LDDENIIYNVEITSGNYDSNSLIEELKNKIEQTLRKNSKINKLQSTDSPYSITQYNRTNINIDIPWNIFKIEMYDEIVINNAIEPIKKKLSENYYGWLLIYHPNHNLKKGDTIV